MRLGRNVAGLEENLVAKMPLQMGKTSENGFFKAGGDLQKQLEIISSTSSTEAQKISALKEIQKMLSAGEVASEQIPAVLAAARDFALANQSAGIELRKEGALTTSYVFVPSYPYPFQDKSKASTQDIDSVLPTLKGIALDKEGDIGLRNACLEAVKTIIYSSTEKNQQQGQIILDFADEACKPESGIFDSAIYMLVDMAYLDFGKVFASASVDQLLDIIERNQGQHLAVSMAVQKFFDYTPGFDKIATDQQIIRAFDLMLGIVPQSFSEKALGAILTFCTNNNRLSAEQLIGKIDEILNLAESQISTAELLRYVQCGIMADALKGNTAFFSSLLERFEALRQNPDLSEEIRNAAGGAVACVCFASPDFFDSQYRQLFSLDPETAKSMMEHSPDWPGTLMPRDLEKIYTISASHPGEPIVGTIFESTHITYFGELHDAYLEHLYYNKDNATGKPLQFALLTTHRQGNSDMGSQFTLENLDKFDVRIVQALTDEEMEALFAKTLERLGIQTYEENPSGRHFKTLVITSHSGPESMRLKSKPDMLDISDIEIYKKMAPYFGQYPVVALLGCSTAGTTQDGGPNILETISSVFGAKGYGSPIDTGAGTLIFGSDETGEPTIVNVKFGNNTVSYDYARAEHASMSLAATQSGNVVNLEWQANDKPTTEAYEIERSLDGKTFERIGIVEPGFGSYSFTDDPPPQTGDATYRIKQRHCTYICFFIRCDFAGPDAKRACDQDLSKSNCRKKSHHGIQAPEGLRCFAETLRCVGKGS